LYKLELLSHGQMLGQTLATTRPYPAQSSLVSLFEEVARTCPEAIALRFTGGALSYRELDERANQLAHGLAARGVGLEDHVAIYLPRSPDAVCAILGILKTGAAYVPLDLEMPPQRIAHILHTASVKCVVTSPQTTFALKEYRHLVFDLGEEENFIASLPVTLFPCPASGTSLAYIMFTSGSTGSPKGVCVEHRNITRLVMNTDYMTFDERQTWLMFSNLAFDASTLELWGSLLHGATLAIYPPSLPSLSELGASRITRSLRCGLQAVFSTRWWISKVKTFLASVRLWLAVKLCRWNMCGGFWRNFRL
jgi:non-ribosomal peptide synthetase component F